MSKIDHNGVSSYDLSYLTFLEAVEEFKGYLTGLPKNSLETDIVNITQDFESGNSYFEQLAIQEKESLTKTKKIISNIFDRTSGGYLSPDIVNLNHRMLKGLDYPVDMGNYLHFIGNNTELNSSLKGMGTNPFINTIPHYEKDSTFTINTALKHQNNPEALFSTEASEDEKEDKIYVSGISSGEDKNFIGPIGVNESDKLGNRYNSPHINAFVLRSPALSVESRNSSHLPIFFNAVPPLEMSRCTPYINLTMMTRGYKGRKNISFANTFRYGSVESAGDDKTKSVFIADDGVKFSDYTPINSVAEEMAGSYDFNYMDLFTSPQTLSNADINKKSESLFDISNQDNPVLEPIMPLLSLKSLTVSISGKGYGMMSSKKASMMLTLHDRSRLSEISALVASDQIGGTKFIIEYGWNHPEGFYGSDNIIAKYLNALKDIAVYGVTASNYTFKEGGQVDITLTLHIQAYRDANSIHIGSGPAVSSSVIEDIVSIVVEELKEKNKEAENFKEVRQKLETARNDATSIYSSVSWEDYRTFADYLKGGGKSSIEEYKGELKSKIHSYVSNSNANVESQKTSNDFNNKKKQSMREYVYAKLEYLKSDSFIDPYLTSYHSNYTLLNESDSLTYEEIYARYIDDLFNFNDVKSQDTAAYGKYVTLGSVISTFLGYPQAASCRFDEVQLIFNPLNHQSGGARRYTTANFPISLNDLERVIQENIKKNVSLTFNNFMDILVKDIIEDRSSLAYGASKQYDELNKFKTEALKDDEAIIFFVQRGIEEGTLSLNAEDRENQLLIESYEKIDKFPDEKLDYFFNIKVADLISEDGEEPATPQESSYNKTFLQKCKEIYNDYYNKKLEGYVEAAETTAINTLYKNDSLYRNIGATDFIVPNISFTYEVVPVSPGTRTNDEMQVSSDSSKIGNLLNVVNRSISSSIKGIDYEKNLLRINIFDEESVSNPEELSLLKLKTEGDSSNLSDRITALTKSQVKNLIKRKYPTIIYGAMSATIDSISVSANTSGAHTNILAVEGYKNTVNAPVNGANYEDPFGSLLLFPGKLTIVCAGMPMIGMGNEVYVDFSTNTTLDNIYRVINVSHNINNGKFSTTLELVVTNQGSFSDFRKKLINLASKL